MPITPKNKPEYEWDLTPNEVIPDKKVICINQYKTFSRKGNRYILRISPNSPSGDDFWYSIHDHDVGDITLFHIDPKDENVDEYFIDELKYKLNLLLKSE